MKLPFTQSYDVYEYLHTNVLCSDSKTQPEPRVMRNISLRDYSSKFYGYIFEPSSEIFPGVVVTAKTSACQTQEELYDFLDAAADGSMVLHTAVIEYFLVTSEVGPDFVQTPVDEPYLRTQVKLRYAEVDEVVLKLLRSGHGTV